MYFLFGGGEGGFWEAAVLRGRHKGFFGEVGGGNKAVCLKTRTLYLGEEMFMGEGGVSWERYRGFSGGYRGFFWGGGIKF